MANKATGAGVRRSASCNDLRRHQRRWARERATAPGTSARFLDRPFPEPLPRWDLEVERLADMWATEHESRRDVIDRYRRVWHHSDATVAALALDATGRVAWWQDAEVPLLNILVHLLAETSRHAGHADILREELDGTVGTDAEGMAEESHDPDFWMERREEIEAAARSAV